MLYIFYGKNSKEAGETPVSSLLSLQLSRCRLTPDFVCGIDDIRHPAISLQHHQIIGLLCVPDIF